MRRQRMGGSVSHRRAGWWRSARVPAVGAWLVVAEWILVDELGTPPMQLRTLGHLGDAWADPVASVLALMALAAEALVAYLLVVLLLRSLGRVPGTLGRVATRVTRVVAPVAVRRTLELLVGGTLLAQTTLAVVPAIPSDHRTGPGPIALVTSCSFTGLSRPAAQTDQVASDVGATRLVQAGRETEPVDTRPTTPGRLSAPLPPWLGGGPSNQTVDPSDGAAAAGLHTVEPHDTLWGIAAAQLVPADRSATKIHRYWQQVYRANRRVIGADPDLIHPGTRLDVPPYRRGHR
jgi:hypothetical protein